MRALLAAPGFAVAISLSGILVAGCAAPPNFVEKVEGIDLSFVERFIATEWRHVYWNEDGTVDELNFLRTPVRDADMAEVALHPRLRLLKLGETAVGDEGLMHLAGLRELKMLGLRSTRVRGPGLAAFQQLPALQSVLLGDTTVDDAGVAHLRNHPRIKELGLNGTRITDESLRHLQTLPELALLHVRDCDVSDEAVAELRKVRPGIQISPYDDPSPEEIKRGGNLKLPIEDGQPRRLVSPGD